MASDKPEPLNTRARARHRTPSAGQSETTRKATRTSAKRSGPRREILASDVLDKAARLFAARGFAATSLQDIADEVGLGRTSIYYYFDSKDALLHALVRGVTREAGRIFDELDRAADLSPSAKVRAAARRLVLWVIDPGTHFKLVDRSEHELPAPIATAHRQAKRRVLGGMSGLIEAGIAAGEIRAVDASVAAFAIIGMCNWTAWWFKPDGQKSAAQIADEIAEFAVASLRRPSARTAGDVHSLTQSIRGDLDLIDRLHRASPRGPA
jgi:AcrR family transcriptional regulator